MLGIATNAQTQINLATQVRGNLATSHLNSGTGASNTTFWRGDGTWATPAGGGNGCTPSGGTPNAILYDTGLGACDDVSGMTWVVGSSSLVGGGALTMNLSGITLLQIPSATRIPGTAHGVIISEGSGTSYVVISPGTNGQILESAGAGADPAFQDPIVSGPDAPGVAPTKNPVQIGLFDGTNVQRVLGSAAGRLSIDVNTLPAIPAGSNVIGHVITDTGSTTTVTGNVTVVQGTGTNLHAVLDTTSTTAVTQATAANLNDTATQGPAAATTAGWPVINGTVARGTATWTNATANNTALTVTTTGYGQSLVTVNTTSTITQGTLNFEASDDGGTTWFAAQCNDTNLYTAATTYALVASTLQALECDIGGFNGFRVRLNPVILGTGQAVIGISTISGVVEPNVTVGQSNAAQLNATVTCSAAVNCPVNATQNTSPWVDNVSQFGGSNVVTGTGAGGAGIPRVTISNDSSLAANQSVNVAQVNGVTTSTGSGAVGTGSQRVSVGIDTATIAGTAPLANNATASGTNALPILEGIAQTSYANGTAFTAGRDVSPDVFTDGALHVAALPAMRPASYHASASFAGSSTTVAAHLAGNATNTVLVTKIMWTCTQTTAGLLTVTVNKTSAASTGGTAATMTAIPDDSNYAGASSVAQSFTGTGPTAGTPVGQIDAAKVGCGATTSVNNDIYILNLRMKPIVLRGTAQTLEIGTGAAITGGNVTVTFEWMETATITP